MHQLESSQRQLEDSREELDQGWEDYETGLQQWEDGEKAYQEGYESYTQSRQEAEDQLKDGRKEVEQAKRDLTLLEDGEWYILDRNTNTGYVSYSMDADRIANLAAVFPLDLLPGGSFGEPDHHDPHGGGTAHHHRWAESHGLFPGKHSHKVCGLWVPLQCDWCGAGVGRWPDAAPWIICTAWSAMYTIGDIHYSFEAATSLLAAGAAVGTVTLAALLACASPPWQLRRRS